jgi:hypothetical protein
MLYLRNNGKLPVTGVHAGLKITVNPGETTAPLAVTRNMRREILMPEEYGLKMANDHAQAGLVLIDDEVTPLDSPEVKALDAQGFRRFVDWLRTQVRMFNSLNLSQANKGIELIPMPDTVRDCIALLHQIEGKVEGVQSGEELRAISERSGQKATELLENMRQALLSGDIDAARHYAGVDVEAGADVPDDEVSVPVPSKVARRRQRAR